MAKIKIETTKSETSKKEKITALIKERASKLFDREPTASVQPAEVAKLVEDILAL